MANSPNDALKPLLNLSDKIQASKRDIITLAAVTLEGAIKEELSRPGTGRVYVIGRTKGRLLKSGKRSASRLRTHQASAPGEPPAPDKGALRNSIHHEIATDGNSARVGTNLVYAKPLNDGTTTAGRNHHTTIAPRPFMQPALNSVREQLNAVVVSHLRSLPKGL